MLSLLQTQPPRRAARLHLADPTSAAVRFQDGSCVPARLQVLSVTGGLLRVPRPLPVDRGADVKVMFLIRTGLVAGAAQMLHALCWNLQPFRFVELPTEEKRKLEAVVRQAPDVDRAEHSRIELGRAW
jgi:hypothetical protein